MLTRFQVNNKEKYYNYGIRCYTDGQRKDIGFDLPIEHRHAFFRGYEDAMRLDTKPRRNSLDALSSAVSKMKM